MRARTLSVIAIVAAACAALAFAGIAGAGDVAAKRSKTRLTVQTWPGGVFGYVDSPSTKRCAKHRKVFVFKQHGAGQDPQKDKLVGRDVAKRNQGGYQWSKRTGDKGKFYAKARKADGCRPAVSKTVRMEARGDVPSCPSSGEVCKFDQMHIDINTYCPGFGYDNGDCSGDSTGGPSPWSPAFGYFLWDEDSGSRHRTIEYHATRDSGDKTPLAELFGSAPDPGSADFTVDKAIAQASSLPDLRWFTPDLASVPAGQQGGPLYLDFENGTIGADVYIRGYLYRK